MLALLLVCFSGVIARSDSGTTHVVPESPALGGSSLGQASARLRLRHDSDHGSHSTDDVPPQGMLTPLDSVAVQVYRRLMTTGIGDQNGSCDPVEFSQKSGVDLVEFVRAASRDCIGQLYKVSGETAAAIFTVDNRITIANSLADNADQYPGYDDNGILNEITFLRAYYFVQFRDELVAGIDPASSTAVADALTRFFDSSHFDDVTDSHGEVLREIITLVDSAELVIDFLPVFIELLDRFNAEFARSYSMSAAVNGIFFGLFRVRQYDASRYQETLRQSQQVIHSLNRLVVENTALAGSDSEYVWRNAGGEVARFLQDEDSSASVARPYVQSLLSNYSHTGVGAGLYIRVADVALQLDPQNCDLYGICTLKVDVEAEILSQLTECSPSLLMRSQALDAMQSQQACVLLVAQSSVFHERLQTAEVPVAGDQNDVLEIVVFDSAEEYGIYAGFLFDVETNNGGIYLEGSPNESGNRARFVAYEDVAIDLETSAGIRNLLHEHVHYLDGRFNTAGDFADALRAGIVWWVEGLAEYISLGDINDSAMEAAVAGSRLLSEIFTTDYSDETGDIYDQSYLAVRFFFEQRSNDLSSLLRLFRQARYHGVDDSYSAFVDDIGTSLDAAFSSWVDATVDRTQAENIALKDFSLVGGASEGGGIEASIAEGEGAVLLFTWPPPAEGNYALYLEVSGAHESLLFQVFPEGSASFDWSGYGLTADVLIHGYFAIYDTAGNFVSEAPDFYFRPADFLDTDGDGLNNTLDSDDDDDGIPDAFEMIHGLNPLVPDATADPDGDGVSNLQEFVSGTDPNDSRSVDLCAVAPANAALESDSSLPFEQLLYTVNPGSNYAQQSFLRIVNPNDSAAIVEIYGIDDSGTRSSTGPLTFTLMPQASIQVTAQELENGSSMKALDGQLCDGAGKWRLAVRSSLPVKAMALLRTPDGFVTSLDDVAVRDSGSSLAYFGNPASNLQQQTFLRVINHSATLGSVVINGLDDAGRLSAGGVFMTLQPWQAKQITAQDLEYGNPAKGVGGALGDGDGKWWFVVDAGEDMNLVVSSLVRSSDGFLTNLSSAEFPQAPGRTRINLAYAAAEPQRQTFIRVINASDTEGEVRLSGIDDMGTPAPGGEVSFELAPWQSTQLTMADLESGNAGKGLSGKFGTGSGHWRLTAMSSLDLRVLSLVRTPNGFLTDLGASVPAQDGSNDIWVFNPASNIRQRSILRLINSGDDDAIATIAGIDDEGIQGSAVQAEIPAQTAYFLSSADLEHGNAEKGLIGAMGNGTGKWRLQVQADPTVQVMNLLETNDGFVTNLSRAGH